MSLWDSLFSEPIFLISIALFALLVVAAIGLMIVPGVLSLLRQMTQARPSKKKAPQQGAKVRQAAAQPAEPKPAATAAATASATAAFQPTPQPEAEAGQEEEQAEAANGETDPDSIQAILETFFEDDESAFRMDALLDGTIEVPAQDLADMAADIASRLHELGEG